MPVLLQGTQVPIKHSISFRLTLMIMVTSLGAQHISDAPHEYYVFPECDSVMIFCPCKMLIILLTALSILDLYISSFIINNNILFRLVWFLLVFQNLSIIL